MKRMVVRALVILVVLVVGISAGFGFEHWQLEKERKVHQDKLNEANRKFALIQKRYTEEKALSYNLEGQKRSALEEVEKLRKDNEALGEAVRELKAGVVAYEEQNKQAVEKLARFKLALDEQEKRFAETVQAVRERETEVKRLSAEQQALQADLKKHREGLERCEGNNARLCIIAADILEKYEKKGVLTALSQNEPLTQLKKVELEKYVQEYRQQIDQEKVKKQSKSGNK